MLDDILDHHLNIVFCGTAAGAVSAKRNQYYAGPGNKFWPTLYKIGLTPRLLSPSEYRSVGQYGIGLTDVVKGQSGSDADIDFKRSNPQVLREKMLHYQPKILAFNGKKSAQVFLGKTRIALGLQTDMIGKTQLVVLPSTSGAANGFWQEATWFELAGLLDI
ncbi:mismatch-specific DNA-glycosylase [Vibrio nitrifigilis]|uniref:Mismatch-specific DNA-glycosylase n=1 Tax=Vibrio nitrifigilis TaxID=2789781 RepID=A0ABS0GKV0_9VIBR|nr:mismatch-specific DNA-glycosylase [Vibrio nitrifigilis]MBF9003105.1 mismatch-specific DNA-glycosylase [Vibrio nitrifigilis]